MSISKNQRKAVEEQKLRGMSEAQPSRQSKGYAKLRHRGPIDKDKTKSAGESAMKWWTTPTLERSKETGPGSGAYNFFAENFSSPVDIGIEAAGLALLPAGILSKGYKAYKGLSGLKKAAAATPLVAGGGLLGAGMTSGAISEGGKALDPDRSTADRVESGLGAAAMGLLPALGAKHAVKKGAKGIAKKMGKSSGGPDIPFDPQDAEARRQFYSESDPLPPKPDRQADIDVAKEEYLARARENGTTPEVEELGDAFEDTTPEMRKTGIGTILADHAVLAADRVKRFPTDVKNFWFKNQSDFSEAGRVEAIKNGFEEFVADDFVAGALAIAKSPRGNKGWWTKRVELASDRMDYQQVVKAMKHEETLNHGLAKRMAGWKEVRGDILFSPIRTDLEAMGRGGQELLQGVTRYTNALGVQSSKYIKHMYKITEKLSENQLLHFMDRISGTPTANLPQLAAGEDEAVEAAAGFWQDQVADKMHLWARENGLLKLDLNKVDTPAPDAATDGHFMEWLDDQFKTEYPNGVTASRLLPSQRIKLAQGQSIKVDGVQHSGQDLRSKFNESVKGSKGIHASKANLVNKIYNMTKQIARAQEMKTGDFKDEASFISTQIDEIGQTFGPGARKKADLYMSRIFDEDILPLNTAGDVFIGEAKQMSIVAYLWNYTFTALPQLAFGGAMNTQLRAMDHIGQYLTRSDAKEVFREMADELGSQQLTKNFLYDANLISPTMMNRVDQFSSFERGARAITAQNGIDTVRRMEMRLRKNPHDTQAREFFKDALGLPVKNGDSILDDMIWREPEVPIEGMDGWLTDDEFLKSGHHFLRMAGGNADAVNLPYYASDPKFKLLYFLRKMVMVNLASAQYVTRNGGADAIPKLVAQHAALTEIGASSTNMFTGLGQWGLEKLGVEGTGPGPIDSVMARYQSGVEDPMQLAVENIVGGALIGSQGKFMRDLYEGRPNTHDLMLLLSPALKEIVANTVQLEFPEAASAAAAGLAGPIAGGAVDVAAEAVAPEEENKPLDLSGPHRFKMDWQN